MRKLAFRYRRVKEIYNTYKNNVGGKLSFYFTLCLYGCWEVGGWRLCSICSFLPGVLSWIVNWEVWSR